MTAPVVYLTVAEAAAVPAMPRSGTAMSVTTICMISELWSLGQENLEFQTNLGHRAGPCLTNIVKVMHGSTVVIRR